MIIAINRSTDDMEKELLKIENEQMKRSIRFLQKENNNLHCALRSVIRAHADSYDDALITDIDGR